ncbi:MAG: exodeoxyribonuclease VII small subunit [Thermoanaerobaculia bacterium]
MSEREPTFGEAMEQLEAILRRVEGEEIDIDELASELQRAARLLELARGKIRRAELEVSQILQTLERAQRDEGSQGEPEAGEDLPS